MRIFGIITSLTFLLILDNARGKSVSSFADGELVIIPKKEDGELVIIPKRDDGEVVIMPKREDDGEVVIMPKRENDGEVVIMPKRDDDGEVVIMPKREDDGEVVIIPKRENDGEVVIMAKRENDGEHVIMPKRDDGEHVIMPKREDDDEHVIMPKRDDGEHVIIPKIEVDGEHVIMPKREEDGEVVIMPKRENDGEHVIMPKREDDGEVVIMPKRKNDIALAKLTSTTCKCGRKNPIVRIVGGVLTTLHEYPWQVGLVTPSGTKPFCGGSIISNQYILTAAHCVQGESPANFRVVIGEHNTASTTETSVTKYIGVQSIKVHPGFNSNTMNNDLALLRLSKTIAFPANNKVAPICLPPAGKTYAGAQATVTGWGTTTEGGSVSSILREVTIPILTSARCKELLGSTTITVNMLCAGPEAGGKDSCQGDSGGPLTTSGGPNYQVLAGIVSWGYGCARPKEPGVYTKVNNYLSWINTNIAGSTTCATP